MFVRSDPPGPGPQADTAAAVAALKAHGAPAGCLVAWDTETAADAAYIRAVHGLLDRAGYTLIVYGSQSDVLGNQNPDGLYWGADWTGVPHLAGQDAMTQYVSFAGYDESAAQASLPFWDTRTAPHPAAAWSPVTVSLPVLTAGITDATLPHPYVRRVQVLANGIYATAPPLAADGAYGPLTEAAVRVIQQGAGLAADGITGPLTWAILLAGAAH